MHVSEANSFAKAASLRYERPWSHSHAAFMVALCASSISIAMSAHLKLTAWYWLIGRPNATRSLAYLTDSSRHPCARPTDSAATPMRPQSNAFRKDLKPSPRPPRRFSFGTLQSEKESSWVSEDCQPILRYLGATVYPRVPLGTMMLLISFLPISSPVTAVMTTRSEMSVPELVMKHLVPLMTHSSPSSTAVVLVLPASDPASGSVSPKAPRPVP